MKIKPGQILPINYQLWPDNPQCIAQAMILKNVDDDLYEMCPVHANIESARFEDLIINGEELKSGIDMVIMPREAANYPALALDTSEDDPEFDLGPIVTEEEGGKILANVDKILSAAADGKEAYSVLRGNHLPSTSEQAKWAMTLQKEWQTFRVSAMCAAAKKCKAPGYINITKLVSWAESWLGQMLNPESSQQTPTMANPDMGFANAANLAGKHSRQVAGSTEAQQAKTELGKRTRNDDIKKLLNSQNPADLLEAVLRTKDDEPV